MNRLNKVRIAVVFLSLLSVTPAWATASLSPGYISSVANQGDMKAALEQWVLFDDEHLGAAAESTLTIAANAVTPPAASGNVFSIDTSGGAANLDNIVATNIPDGRWVAIRCANPSANPVTVRHNQAGSLPILMSNSSNFTFASTKEWLLLKRTGSTFEEIGRFYGDRTSDFQTYLGLGTAAVLNEGTGSSNIPNITHADSRYAQLAGLSTQTFAVANAVGSNDAVSKSFGDSRYAALAGLSTQQFSSADPTSSQNVVTKNYGDANYLSVPIESGQLSISGGASVSFAHGLGVTPTRYWAMLECTTTNNGYTSGVLVNPVGTYNVQSSSGSTITYGCAVYADATNVYAQIGAQGFMLPNGSGNAVALSGSQWKLRLFCQK